MKVATKIVLSTDRGKSLIEVDQDGHEFRIPGLSFKVEDIDPLIEALQETQGILCRLISED